MTLCHSVLHSGVSCTPNGAPAHSGAAVPEPCTVPWEATAGLWRCTAGVAGCRPTGYAERACMTAIHRHGLSSGQGRHGRMGRYAETLTMHSASGPYSAPATLLDLSPFLGVSAGGITIGTGDRHSKRACAASAGGAYRI